MEYYNRPEGGLEPPHPQQQTHNEQPVHLAAEAAAAAIDPATVGAVALHRQVEAGGSKPSRSEQVTALQKQITNEVESLVDAGAWQRMLTVAARFHDYSFGNQLLIAAQCPDATRVAGYRAWQKLSRQVRKGERSIAILAPMTYVVEPDEQDADPNAKPQVIQRFKVAHVFDISQTDGGSCN